jgi:hypothetical protein
LKDTKEKLWKKYSELYPNGLKRTSFICRINKDQYKYKEDLEGLCITCDFYGYQIFDKLLNIINSSNLLEKKDYINRIEQIRRHLKRDMENEISILNNGKLEHSPCLNHCLLNAFGVCEEEHYSFCKNCCSFIIFLNELKLKNLVNNEEFEEFEDKLLYYISHQLRKIFLNSQYKTALTKITETSAVLICDYKMKVLPKNSRETKQDFFGKEGWTLHSIIVIFKSMNEENQLSIEAYDHYSNDGKQDAWFTASAFDIVLPKLKKNNIKQIEIFSDNGGHYHNSELITIISNWKNWYNIEIKRWQFLEAGEAKTIVDSHHAKLSHGFVRYTKLGKAIKKGEDIALANKDLVGTTFAEIIPDRDRKINIGTISGISNFFTFEWPQDENEGLIKAYEIPYYSSPKVFTIFDIKKLLKDNIINKPNPELKNELSSELEWHIKIPSYIDPEIEKLTVEQVKDQLKEMQVDNSGNKKKLKEKLSNISQLNKEKLIEYDDIDDNM